MLVKLLLESIFLGFCGEMGDKTQWLALSLALRTNRAPQLLAAVFIGSLSNHLLAASLGDWLSTLVPARVLSLAMASLFLLFAVLIVRSPRTGDASPQAPPLRFTGLVVLFFLAETGDKTQLATLALAAKSSSFWIPAIGTTLGTLLSDALAVTLGTALMRKIPEPVLRVACAVTFLAFGFVWLLTA